MWASRLGPLQQSSQNFLPCAFLPVYDTAPRARLFPSGFTDRNYARPLPGNDSLKAERYESCPTGLMASADTPSGISMEVLIEKNQIFPVWIDRIANIFAVAWPSSLRVSGEERAQSTTQLVRDLLKV